MRDGANIWDDDAADEESVAPSAEIIGDDTLASVAGAADNDADGDADGVADGEAAFAALLASLRALPGPCAPPIGEGAFDILYASAREIVVWFVSARDGAAQKEVVIPARLAREAWALIRRGEPVSEAMLRAIAPGAAGGRWLLALFAQLPSVEVRAAEQADDADDADDADEAAQAVTLRWRGER